MTTNIAFDEMSRKIDALEQFLQVSRVPHNMVVRYKRTEIACAVNKTLRVERRLRGPCKILRDFLDSIFPAFLLFCLFRGEGRVERSSLSSNARSLVRSREEGCSTKDTDLRGRGQ